MTLWRIEYTTTEVIELRAASEGDAMEEAQRVRPETAIARCSRRPTPYAGEMSTMVGAVDATSWTRRA